MCLQVTFHAMCPPNDGVLLVTRMRPVWMDHFRRGQRVEFHMMVMSSCSLDSSYKEAFQLPAFLGIPGKSTRSFSSGSISTLPSDPVLGIRREPRFKQVDTDWQRGFGRTTWWSWESGKHRQTTCDKTCDHNKCVHNMTRG